MSAAASKSMADWLVAGACSVGVHLVFIGFLYVVGGGAKEPLDPAVANSTVTSPALAGDSSPTPAAGAETETPPSELDTVSGRNAGRPSAANNSGRGAERAPAAAAPAHPAGETPVKTKNYTVKRGDSLIRLARKCGSTPAELAKLNGTDEKKLSALQPGQTIKIKDND